MNKKLLFPIARNSKGGYIMILNSLLFISIVFVIIVAISNALLSRYASANGALASKQAYLSADSGIHEVLYRLMSGKNVSDTENITLGSKSAQVVLSTITGGKQLISTANVDGFIRNIKIKLSLGTGVSFHYGIQAGRGGFELQNSSSVTGNVFSAGPIIGSGDNYIRGDAISAGPTGMISGIHATGSVYAHTIDDSKVDDDAFYTTITDTTVSGTKYPNSPDQPIAPLPISDEQIEEWKADAANGGTATCTSGKYTINSDVTIGPKMIPCDLDIIGGGSGITVTIAGPIWVQGNIDISLKPLIRMHPSLGLENVAIIADNPADRINSSRIFISQNASFSGSGQPGSFVFMISQNRSAEDGTPSTPLDAIVMNNGAAALVGYAAHGLVTLAQSVSIKEVTAYKILLKNTANVIYDTGLPSVLFKAGPGGGYDILDWLEF